MHESRGEILCYNDVRREEEKWRVIIYCRAVLDSNTVSVDRHQLYHHQLGERRTIQLYYYSYATHHYTGKYIVLHQMYHNDGEIIIPIVYCRAAPD